jgi:hypothetical protein
MGWYSRLSADLRIEVLNPWCEIINTSVGNPVKVSRVTFNNPVKFHLKEK